MLKLVFLVSCLVPLALCYPYYPSTCYSKVLVKAQEVNHLAAYVKSAPAVSTCVAHLPAFHVDVHNGCVMYKMRRYISLVDGLRHHGCAYNAELRRLGSNLKQLHLILRDRCHGDLAYTGYDCAALEH
ncbi:Cytokine-like protein 1 [Oryzias melastigma]|uniref:Cytokine-like protein 1 n=1 Tax=Oryzias melastigma TaxID=30732 RepID=A0A834CLD2_ORYME|nr:CYTL1 domain-containing protein [Oryzias melastigma]KAF6731575.1 Cytokine-like protein 1 [Oryzias melastigma]